MRDHKALVAVHSTEGAAIQIQGLNDLPLSADDLFIDGFGRNANEARREFSQQHLET